jgi:integrase
MRPRRDGVKVYGPYERGNLWRVHVVTTSGGARTTAYESFDTLAEAEAFIDGARDEAQGVTLRMAVDEFVDEKKRSGLAATTIENYEHRLWRLLGLPKTATRPVRWVSLRGPELYKASIGTGAADTHINGLNVGRMWGNWCVEQKYLRANPFAKVKKVGRKRKGSTKERLSVDESRRLEAHCFANAGDQDCVLTYGYLMLGKRASELVRLRVCDLDDNGWMVRILDAKSAASIGSIPVSPELREMLIGLAKGRAPDARLFVNLNGRPMTRYVARDRVKAVLKAAGVTVMPPQALRRTFVDNANRQGVALRTIAEMAGHTSTAVTERSYMSPDQKQAGLVERNLKAVRGNNNGNTFKPGSSGEG